jgi:CHAT domain-containing protein
MAMATHLHELANLYLMQQRYADAKPCYQRALEVLERLGLNDTLEIADNLDALGILHEEQGDVSAAEPLLMRAFKIRETVLGDQHPRVAMSCTNLSVLRRAMGDHASAQSLARRAMSIYESCLAGPTAMFEPTFILADAEWAQGRRDAALTELDRALDMAESERRGASGGEQELGRLFSQLLFAFERMIAWQAELGHTAEAVLALERGRARSLVDQLATQQIDLLADVPHSEARELRDRDAAAQRQVVALERQLEVAAMRTDLSDADLRTMQRELEKQLTRARAEIVAVYRDIRNASPAYRQAVGQDYRPLPLPDIQAWVAEQNGALLEYVIGVESSHVFVIPPAGEARVERLTLNDERAKALGVEPGDLTSAKLATTWQLGTGDLGDALTNPHTAARDGGDHDSADQISCDRGLTLVTEALARPASAAATTARLALLWQILIPPSAQAVVTSATCQRLFVVPDGLLATLPFEVLVVEAGPQPKYFLDVSPPIVYAPSATVLVNLAGQSTKATKSAPQPVLTVANPTYRGRPQETDPTLLASTPRTRFWSSVGQLQPLPYTDQESKWVVDVFKQRGIKSGALRDRSATEVGARLNVPGREIIHFACHGLVDQMHGNFFGALALTPGKSNAGATDDGFLTLAEIYGLPLDGCELAILSACQTNLGLQQRGEGLYGLSRGFLVAGARRVVASNWLVDDEAAATLVSVFCSAIAKSKEQKLPVDYAAALHAAKRRIRQNERWQSPFYWGTFVLIGPP